MGWLKDLRERRPVLGELVRQLIDQPLHILMTVGSVWGIGGSAWAIFYFTGDGTVTGIKLLTCLVAGSTLTATWVALRERAQWPSSRWWDPPLDWFFEVVGMSLGVWSLGPVARQIIALLG